MTVIKKKMKSFRNDMERLPFITMHFLDEYYGDPTPTVQIINHLRPHIKNSEATAADTVVKTAEVSTSKLVKELQLDASDTNFENFQKKFNDQCFLALNSMYGEFTSLTRPILTQSTLSEIADRFKTTLPKHYHSISALLN